MYRLTDETTREFETLPHCLGSMFVDERVCGVKTGDGDYDKCGGVLTISNMQFAHANPWILPFIVGRMHVDEILSLPRTFEKFGHKLVYMHNVL